MPTPVSVRTCDMVRGVGVAASSRLATSVNPELSVGAVLAPGRTFTVKLFGVGSRSTPPEAVPPLS